MKNSNLNTMRKRLPSLNALRAVALGMQPFVTGDLEAGLLTEPFPNRRIYNDDNWYLVCRKGKVDSDKIAIDRDWLLDQVHKEPMMPSDRL